MVLFRSFLVFLTIVIYGYTALTIYNSGINLIPVFFGDIAKMQWPGQFNTDFSCFLLLSGLWISWRNKFSLSGIVLGILGTVLGMSLLAPYLLFLTFETRGDIERVLLGRSRSN